MPEFVVRLQTALEKLADDPKFEGKIVVLLPDQQPPSSAAPDQ
jgi:hypothetical protein